MFRGISFHTIDNKGRLIIPSRFRDVIRVNGNESIMVSGMDDCLVAYTIDGWRDLENKILSMAETSANMRRFRRLFIGAAFECGCDKQDRILIPPMLRQYASLEKEIVLVGVLTHFEIWCRGKWDMESTNLSKDMKKEDVRNEIAKLGI